MLIISATLSSTIKLRHQGEEKVEVKVSFARRGVNTCPGFSWDKVNLPPNSCCVLDLV